MLEIIELLAHCFVTLIKLLKPGGVKAVMAETIAMKQQLIVRSRRRKRAPSLATGETKIQQTLFEAFGITISRFAVSVHLPNSSPP